MSGHGMHQQQVTIDTASRGRGLYDVTDTIRPIVAQSGIQTGETSAAVSKNAADEISPGTS